MSVTVTRDGDGGDEEGNYVPPPGMEGLTFGTVRHAVVGDAAPYGAPMRHHLDCR